MRSEGGSCEGPGQQLGRAGVDRSANLIVAVRDVAKHGAPFGHATHEVRFLELQNSAVCNAARNVECLGKRPLGLTWVGAHPVKDAALQRVVDGGQSFLAVRWENACGRDR